MLVSTTETVPAREPAEIPGIAKGNTVQARNVAGTAPVRTITGGEPESYTGLLTDARESARTDEDETEAMDAIVNSCFETSQITDGGSEILASGTAVGLARQGSYTNPLQFGPTGLCATRGERSP